MNQPPVIAATIAAIVAVGSAILNIVSGARMARLQHRLTMEREERTRQMQLADVMGRFREPVLRSADDLQRRFYNIAEKQFLQVYYFKSEPERDYAITNTLYVVAEYLGWVEILRREVQYLDLGDMQANRVLANHLDRISTWFLTDRVDDAFRVFRGEQRAIGEVMLVARSGDAAVRHECLGYAAFTEKIKDPQFAKWFTRMTDDITQLAKSNTIRHQRMQELQHALIDLINFFDPDKVRVPEDRRKKIQ
jgi:hypothetical protein